MENQTLWRVLTYLMHLDQANAALHGQATRFSELTIALAEMLDTGGANPEADALLDQVLGDVRYGPVVFVDEIDEID